MGSRVIGASAEIVASSCWGGSRKWSANFGVAIAIRQALDSAAQILRQEVERHDHERRASDHLPAHHRDAVGERRPVEPHQLLGGKVRQEQRPSDESAGQSAPREEVAGGSSVVVFAGEIPGDSADKGREEKKRGDGHGGEC